MFGIFVRGVFTIYCAIIPGEGHSVWGADSIVWGLGFWLEKDIFKNIDMDNSQGVDKIIFMDN